MSTLDMAAISRRYSHALDAKPSKGAITADGIAAITDSVADVPELLAQINDLKAYAAGLQAGTDSLRATLSARMDELAKLRDITDQDALTRESIRLAEGSAMSAAELVECFKSMRDNEWKRRALAAREAHAAKLKTIHDLAAQIADHFGDQWPHTPACQGEPGCPLCLILEATQPLL